MNETMRTFTRLMTALAIALTLGLLLAGGADAKGSKTTASVKDRVQAQRDLCELIGGGLMTVEKSPFGSTITRCYGGTEDGTKCVNTKNSTKCTKARLHAPEDGPAATATAGAVLEANAGPGSTRPAGHPAAAGDGARVLAVAAPDEQP